ncbi:NAD-dependent deacetylase [Gemmatimonadota bacterium]
MADSEIETLAGLIRESSRVLVFTGAGISTASGIPDYRGPQGVWKRRRPVYLQEFLASAEGREEYWDFKLEGWDEYGEARPNALHEACVDLERMGKLELLVTQNIDGLHLAAGTSPEKLVEIHGTDARVSCLRCGVEADPQTCYESFRETRQPPKCDCGGWLKPATISFGQALRAEDLERSFGAARRADLVISLGSTLSVYPAASIPLMAAERGIPYVIVNRGETDQDLHPAVTLRIDGDVGFLFPTALEQAV